jgi:hypothetical protein
VFSRKRTGKAGTRITLADVGLFVFLTTASISPLFLHLSSHRSPPDRVEVVSAGGLERIVPLSREGSYRVSGPLGESVFEIRDQRVRMMESPCSEKICLRSGWKDGAEQAIICAPNRIGLFLKAKAPDLDAVSR